MAYNSRLAGRIEITPPLKWSEFRESRFLNARGDTLLTIESSVDSTDTENGTVTVLQGIAIAPRSVEPFPAYELADELEELARAYPEHTFSGYIVRKGEEQGDVERYWIEGVGPHAETAELRWPDGSEVQS